MKNIVLILAMAFCLAACGVRGIGGSYVGQMPESDCREAIAVEAADFLSNEHAPGHTKVFILTPEKDAKNEFGSSLEQKLRERGFTILQESEKDALSIAYTIDGLKQEDGKGYGAYYVQLRTSDGQAFARSYDVNGQPEAGRSATPLKIGIFNAASKKVSKKVGETYNSAKNAVEEIVYE